MTTELKLPELPMQARSEWPGICYYTADQMREYALAAIASAAPPSAQTVAQEREAFDGAIDVDLAITLARIAHDHVENGKMRHDVGLALEAAARAALAAPAQLSEEQTDALHALQNLTKWAERQICSHDETHRGGVIWEICDMCGAKWADDEGGKPKFKWPTEIEAARALLSAAQGKE